MLPQWLRQIPMDCGVVTLENTLLAVLAKRKQGGDSRSTWSRKWPWIRARLPIEVRRPLDDGPTVQRCATLLGRIFSVATVLDNKATRW